MNEQLISFETAKLAKKKGFDIPVIYHFTSIRGQKPIEQGGKYKNDLPGNVYYIVGEYDSNKSPEGSDDETWSRPTQSLLQKWLREVKKVNVYCNPDHDNEKQWYNNIASSPVTFLGTYEEALEYGLYQALRLIE